MSGRHIAKAMATLVSFCGIALSANLTTSASLPLFLLITCRKPTTGLQESQVLGLESRGDCTCTTHSRFSCRTQMCRARASTRSWPTSASSAGARAGTRRCGTACTAWMRTSSCSRWPRTSRASSSCARCGRDLGVLTVKAEHWLRACEGDMGHSWWNASRKFAAPCVSLSCSHLDVYAVSNHLLSEKTGWNQ